jgi:uncharacterized protein (DUF2147 family)
MGQGRSAAAGELKILAAVPLVLAAQAAASGLPGYWTNERQSVVMQISVCGEGMLCGKVAAASDKAIADARRGGTPDLVGTELMTGFVKSRPGRWKGHLFVPDHNRWSRAEIMMLEDDRLRVRGCALGGMICRSQVWSRAPAVPTSGK